MSRISNNKKSLKNVSISISLKMPNISPICPVLKRQCLNFPANNRESEDVLTNDYK